MEDELFPADEVYASELNPDASRRARNLNIKILTQKHQQVKELERKMAEITRTESIKESRIPAHVLNSTKGSKTFASMVAKVDSMESHYRSGGLIGGKLSAAKIKSRIPSGAGTKATRPTTAS